METVNQYDFASTHPPERPMGSESEYTLAYNVDANGHTITPDWYLTKGLKALGISRVGEMLPNAAMLKGDAWSNNIEYSTPEALGPRRAALEDEYGTELVGRVIKASQLPQPRVYRTAGTFLETGQKDYNPAYGKTSGFHHNFLAPAYIADDEHIGFLKDVLSSHLATRSWSWAGAVKQEGFVPAQKMWGIGAPVRVGRDGNRKRDGQKALATIYTENDNVLGGNKEWIRVEDCVVDPSFSIEMTELTLATTSLVLRIIEHADKLGGQEKIANTVALRDPVAAGRCFAGDLSLKETAETITGERVTALETQRRLAKLAFDLSLIVELPDDEVRAVNRWLDTAESLEQSNPERVQYTESAKHLVNFVPRHTHLARRYGSHKLHADELPAAVESLSWDRIVPEGRGIRREKRIAAGHERAWAREPSRTHTRADMRASYLRKERRRLMNDPNYITWSYLRLLSGEYINFLDPFETSRRVK